MNISSMYLKEVPLQFNELLLSEENNKTNSKDLFFNLIKLQFP